MGLAGRAGRDRAPAKCVLLFAEEDVERQFSLSARSRLDRHEIGAILKALRRIDNKTGKSGEVVATGARTYYGRVAELVRTSNAPSHMQRTILAIVKRLVIFDAALAALVVAASQLTAIVKDVDTVCRVADNRFAVLLESAYRPELLQVFAPHIVARGLSQTPALPLHKPLRYRVVTIALPDWTQDQPPAEEQDVQRLIARLNVVLDRLEPKRVILHLPLADAQVSQPLAA